MLGINYGKYDEPVEIDIEVCKKNYKRTKLGYVNCHDKVLTHRFADTDELTFTVPKYINIDKKRLKNPSYYFLSGDMILKVTVLNDVQYFVVVKCEEIDDDNGIRKEVQAYSYEYTLSNKRIAGFEGVKKLYDITAPDESVLHEIIRLNPSWSIKYVNQDVNKFRDFDVDDESCLEFLYELQETLECIFVFDTVERSISVEKLENIGLNRGLVLNSRNYMKNIKIEPDFNELITRLYVYGKDDVSINSQTTSGESYIDCFEYFLRNPNFTDKELADAYDKYNEKVKARDGEFKQNLKDYQEKNKELSTLKNELAKLQGEIAVIHDKVDLAINTATTTEMDLTSLNNQEQQKQAEIDAKEAEIKAKETEMEDILDKQKALRDELSLENNFTYDQIMSLNEITKVGVLSDTTIADEEELYKEALEKIEKLAQPTINFTTDVVNFMNSLDHQINWEKVLLGIGDVVNIEDENLDLEFKVRLTEVEYREHDDVLTLNFSNKDSINDPALFFADLSSKVNSSFTTINMNKFKYGAYSDDKNEILDYINGELDLSRQQAVAGHNNDIIINERGITTINAQNPNMQTKIMNNMIAFTEDGWKTVKTAIKNGKVIADNIIGKLLIGSEMIIGNADGTLNILGNKIVIRDKDGKEKVVLGEYTSGKFGMKLFNKDGDVILDEDGILQTWQEGRCDNVQSGYPLQLWVYIPSQTKSIKTASLRFKLMRMRDYSTTVGSGGGSEPTSSVGLSSRYTSDAGGNEILAETLGVYRWIDDDTGHNHGIPAGTRLLVYSGVTVTASGERVPVVANPYPDVRWVASGNHQHYLNVTLPSHSHSLPSFSHSHTVNIPPHTHTVTHTITEGSTIASGVQVYINGSWMGYTYYSDQNNIDISTKLTTGGWNLIELRVSTAGRIDASVFIQAMMGTK